MKRNKGLVPIGLMFISLFLTLGSIHGVDAANVSSQTNVTAVSDNTKVYVSHRPKMEDRLFVSHEVEAKIAAIKRMLTNPKLAWMFENCFPNTLDTTVHFREIDGQDDTFVYTGDIHAMWLRDSGAQVWPYIRYANKDPKLKRMLAGVIRRQFKCIGIDPYANAFNDGPTGGEWMTDMTDMKPDLHERKWEIDSLCYPIRLAYEYWKETGDASVFSDDWLKAIELVLKTFTEQQRKEGVGPYKFQRKTDRQLDTNSNNGLGNPVNPVGLIASAFRPSDDANVPSLLGLAYMGDLKVNNPIYQNTRKFVWSNDNPYFFKGKAGEGIGGPHVGYDMIWPMSIMMRAFTSTNDEEIKTCMKMLLSTDAETGFIHESFNKNDPSNFTRPWFAWQNTLFGELVIKLIDDGKLDLLNSIQ